jgi:hypothetical protein
LISAHEAVRTFGYGSDTGLSADKTGFESKTRMIVGPRPVVVQMIPTSPKGVDLTIFLFTPCALLFIFWVERLAAKLPGPMTGWLEPLGFDAKCYQRSMEPHCGRVSFSRLSGCGAFQHHVVANLIHPFAKPVRVSLARTIGP